MIRPAPVENGLVMSEVVAFVASHASSRRGTMTRRAETTALLDAVCSAGALEIAPRAFAARDAAAALQLMGFVTVEEIGRDGARRRLRPSETHCAASFHPWRVSRA